MTGTRDTKETPTVTANSSFDLTKLTERVEHDRELLRELLAIFKEDFPRVLQALREAVENGDMRNVSAVSHTLKGMLSNMVADRAAAAAAQLEQLARAGESAGVPAALEFFESEVSELLPRLNDCMTETRK